MTTIKVALENWEKENEIKASEATEVGLQFQIPPIEKMSMDLAILEKCEHLSLSTNNIAQIILPPTLKNLKILALGRNNIKSLSGLVNHTFFITTSHLFLVIVFF
jgi:dynein light chain 1, axonemal